MGQYPSKYLFPHLWREDEPESHAPIKYHHQFGFDEQRKEQKIKLTLEEMNSAGLESVARDECAHVRVHYRGCIRSHPFSYYKCKGYKNELGQCYMEYRIHDMKEFERERRLNARERRLAANEAS